MAQSKFEMDSGFITTGDSLITGNLTIIGTPVIGTHAATKVYVDTAIAENSGSGWAGHLVPSINSNGTTGYDVGSLSKTWRDLYLASGLYLDATKVIDLTAGTLFIKSAVDQINNKSGTIDESRLTAILEFGIEENYVMIFHENNPIITDIFIRGQDRKNLIESRNQEEIDSFVKRYTSQVKQAVTDFEAKYEKRIRNLKVISNLENIETYLAGFKKNLENTGFNLLDPLDGVQIPQQIKDDLNLKNKSHLSSIIGLAFRKLDVFGHHKFVAASTNINLLPDRIKIVAEKRMKIISNFVFKGSLTAISIIYLFLFGLSASNIMSYNSKLATYPQIISEHEILNKKIAIITKELQIMDKSLNLSKSIQSNKVISYRYLAQIANSVPNRVQFIKIEYDGKNQIIIEGTASTDRDILKLVSNLNSKSLISQASLATMSLANSGSKSNSQRKGFKISVKTKG